MWLWITCTLDHKLFSLQSEQLIRNVFTHIKKNELISDFLCKYTLYMTLIVFELKKILNSCSCRKKNCDPVSVWSKGTLVSIYYDKSVTGKKILVLIYGVFMCYHWCFLLHSIGKKILVMSFGVFLCYNWRFLLHSIEKKLLVLSFGKMVSSTWLQIERYAPRPTWREPSSGSCAANSFETSFELGGRVRCPSSSVGRGMPCATRL